MVDDFKAKIVKSGKRKSVTDTSEDLQIFHGGEPKPSSGNLKRLLRIFAFPRTA